MLREKWRGNIFKLSLQVFSLRFTKDLRVWKNFLKKWSKLDQSFIKEKAIRPDFKRSINGKDRYDRKQPIESSGVLTASSTTKSAGRRVPRHPSRRLTLKG